MDDDFNTGGAIGELFDLVRILNKFCDDAKLETTAGQSGSQTETGLDMLRRGTLVLRELTNILGLFATPPATTADESAGSELVGGLMRLLIDLRATARKKKDFETADAIRNRLTEMGITLEDRPSGTEWTHADPRH
jgi:cysteinyl-tRNA synthetase